MQIEQYQNIVIDSSGGTIPLPLTDFTSQYNVTGTATLLSSLDIIPDPSTTAYAGMIVKIYYSAALTIGVNTVTIFGYTFLPQEALQNWEIYSIYQGSTWQTFVVPDYSDNRVKQFQGKLDVSASQILNLNNTPIQVLPDPVDDLLAIVMTNCVFEYHDNGTPYDTYTDLWLISEGANVPQMTCNDILLSTVYRNLIGVSYAVNIQTNTQIISSAGIKLMTPDYDPLHGNGTLTLRYTYQIISYH